MPSDYIAKLYGYIPIRIGTPAAYTTDMCCPKCGGMDVVRDDAVSEEEGTVHEDVTCSSCDYHYTNIYVLTGYYGHDEAVVVDKDAMDTIVRRLEVSCAGVCEPCNRGLTLAEEMPRDSGIWTHYVTNGEVEPCTAANIRSAIKMLKGSIGTAPSPQPPWDDGDKVIEHLPKPEGPKNIEVPDPRLHWSVVGAVLFGFASIGYIVGHLTAQIQAIQ